MGRRWSWGGGRKGIRGRDFSSLWRPGAEPTPLGVAPRGKYLYLGPAEETLEGVEVLRWKGRAFVPLRQREMELGDRMVYRWGLFAER